MPSTKEKVMAQIEWDINFIKEIKEINPDAEIIIYLYSPVATEGSELYEQIQKAGFSSYRTIQVNNNFSMRVNFFNFFYKINIPFYLSHHFFGSFSRHT